ncbi:MAG: UDP-2,3-diacylglucosamine diphosphatase LpxI [Acidobacteriota bacterium]
MGRYGLIAGNGRFPFLLLEAARSQGIRMVVVAIKEETFPEIAEQAETLHWISLGELSKLIKIFHREGVTQAIMAGQVKHKQIFSSIVPDLKLLKLLTSLKTKNTDSLIGGVARILEEEGIQVIDSTSFLRPLLPEPGLLTHRPPNAVETEDIAYGRRIAHEIARLDLGQTIVVRDQACVAIEAMEGTDAVIQRAADLVGNQRFTVIKVSKPNQDMRFDVPVVGLPTVRLMARLGGSALALDAYRTLLMDREQLIAWANEHQISISAYPPQQ